MPKKFSFIDKSLEQHMGKTLADLVFSWKSCWVVRHIKQDEPQAGNC